LYVQLTYLLKGLELAPLAGVRIVALVPSEKYDTKTDPDRFSFREGAAHWADWEAINQDRLRAGVEVPGCTVQGFDEGQFAIDRNYAVRDPREQMVEFVESRKETVAFLQGLTDDDWQKAVIHSERGLLTVLELAVSILGHDMYHVEHLTQFT
jgi:DinB superfamily